MLKNDFLIEIYTEELPVNCIEEAYQQLNKILKDSLDKFRVDYKEFEYYVTPVRIVIFIKDVKENTKKYEEEILGPSVNIGIKNGEFTPAAVGFAKKFNVELKELFIKDTQKGKFLAIKKTYGGENFKNIINDLFIDIISNLKFPKNMVWEETKFKFPRPIRNILVIYGNSFIKIKFASLVSSNFTFGIKTYPIKKIKIDLHRRISLAESYFAIMRRECIVLDSKERLDILKKSIENITLKEKLKYDQDLKLLKEITSMIEYPTCILCEFPEEFLNLPEEFIITCMKVKQKFIPLYDTTKKLTNKFIGVKNGLSEHLDYVKNGFEKVLIARLNDIKYYYNADKKIEFSKYFEGLKGIVYNSKLSLSYYDKVINIKKLAEFLNEKLAFGVDKEKIEITSKFIKNDLLTQIVFEYPELQGIAGKIYCLEFCKKNNLPEEIALCCCEHLKPKDFNDEIPTNDLSVIYSLADKISTIIENTIIDNLPTGNSDPLGLKRMVDGVIKILLEKKIDIELDKIVKYYCELLNFPINERLINTTVGFFAQRFENILLQKNFKIDEIRTVMFDFKGDFYTRLLMVKNLNTFRDSVDFKKLIELYKRVYNILQQANKKMYNIEGSVDENLFKTDIEFNFYKEIMNYKEKIEKSYNEKNFSDITKKILELKPIVDEFFDKVLIFDENKEVALNRLKLLNVLINILNKIGNLYYIQL
ncbi:MAG: glycine--tRNA ligase subunit beta [Endomicrobiia bacterium]